MKSRDKLRELVKTGESSVGAFRARMDGWFNLMSGLGTSRDKSVAGEFEAEPPLDVQYLEDLFHNNDLAYTGIMAVVDDGLRLGFEPRHGSEEVTGGDANISEVQEASKILKKALDKLKVLEKVAEAWAWGRLFGRGAILLGVEGAGLPETPLDDSKVTAVRFLTVLDRRDLMPDSYYSDPLADNFGEVEVYLLQPQAFGNAPVRSYNIKIHETRLVLFGGAMTSRREQSRNQMCDHSVLQRTHTVLRDCGQNWDSVRAMMADMSQAVFKISGLLDAIAEGDQKTISTRVALMDTLRSITRAVVLDAGIPGQEVGEDFDVKSRTVTGTADLLDKTWLRLAASFRMPVSRLMGQSAAGLNATGEGDRKDWYDTVQAERGREAEPKLVRIIRLVAQSELDNSALDPEGWAAEFPSLWQSSPAEEAKIRESDSNSDTKWIDKAVLLPEEAAISHFGGPKYSSTIRIDIKARRKVLEMELEAMQDPNREPAVVTTAPKGKPGQPSPEVPTPAVAAPAPGAPPAAPEPAR